MSKVLDTGESGRFRLEKKVVPKGSTLRTYSRKGFLYFDTFDNDFPMIRLLDGNSEDPGIWMSDIPLEQEGVRIPVQEAYGDVLEIGLGIGLFPTLLRRRNRKVRSITIVEKEADLISLVYGKIKYKKTKLIISDGRDFLELCQRNNRKYDFIHIDVWPSFNASLKEIGEWTELARPCLRPKGIVWCWLQELYIRIKDQLPKEPIYPTGLPATYPPCLICGKKLRNDYAGLCMDCADYMGLSELYSKK